MVGSRVGAAAAAIPSWQRDATQAPLIESPDSAKEEKKEDVPEVANKTSPSAEPRNHRKEDIEKFLQDPAIKDAPESKKRAFLASKGVPQQMIDDSISGPRTTSSITESVATFDVEQFKSQQAAAGPADSPRDSPPIVTYPEFLVKPQRPPPLVTISGLLSTAYIAGGLATLFYGTSKYLVEPMLANLTQSRHDLASHASDQISNLNSKLERIVSKIPVPALDTSSIGDEDDSITSDPTELFHRDVGVQTSPNLSRRGSFSTLTSPAPIPSALDQQHDRLDSLRTHLDSALDREVSARQPATDLETSISELRDYLNGLVYSPPSHADYGVWSPNHDAHARGAAGRSAKDDAITALRNEIRSVKGVMLSARQFPAISAAGR